jgi:hypothetical protein
MVRPQAAHVFAACPVTTSRLFTRSGMATLRTPA